MTAEAIAMNRSAVALAADSAVTISGPRGFKTFETANKLFELVKGSNIGVMVYSNAAINGTPWETVIKTFRRDYDNIRAAHVEDYFDIFMKYVSEHDGLLKPTDEWDAVSELVDWFCAEIFREFDERFDELTTASGKLVKSRIKEALDEKCSGIERRLSQTADVESSNPGWQRTIPTTFGPAVTERVSKAFSQLPVTQAQTKRVARLALAALTKEGRTPLDSGIVFAGFGTEDYFPQLASAHISARLCKQAITHDRVGFAISVRDPGYLQTFAQDEPARGWIEGISAEVRYAIQEHWLTWVTERFPRELKNELKPNDLTSNQFRAVSEAVLGLAKEQLVEFFNEMQRYEDEKFRQPMLNSVAMLPKDELGLLAESLVNITSLKRRVSIDELNTVGGAIDVALISIGDGFVWLNRKHYFNSDLNPSWHITHSAPYTPSNARIPRREPQEGL